MRRLAWVAAFAQGVVWCAQGVPWTPEVGGDGDGDWDGRALIRRELRRSVAAYPAVAGDAEAKAQVLGLARYVDQLVCYVGGRLFVTAEFLQQSKHKKHAMLVLTARRLAELPSACYLFERDSTGSDGWRLRTGGDPARVPLVVISKKRGYGRPGILAPNPFFEAGNVTKWGRFADFLRREGVARPWGRRVARVFWRGNIGAHGPNPDYDFCDRDSGNYARLEAVSLTLSRPDLFDVRCQKCSPRNVSLHPCAADALDAPMRAVLADSRNVRDEAWVNPKDYGAYRALLNLPGTTAGGYSRNLNHLWVLGAPVLLWDAPLVEFYYPALRAGASHLAVDRSDAATTAAAVLQDADAAAHLAKGAADVYDAHLCPRCLADYLKDAYDAMRDRFRLGAVLDGVTDAPAFLREVACAAQGPVDFHEVFDGHHEVTSAPVALPPCRRRES